MKNLDMDREDSNKEFDEQFRKDSERKQPIKITDVQILDHKNEKGNKMIKFEFNNEYFCYRYSASGGYGGIHIKKYDNINTLMNPLSTTGKEEIIYNTFNNNQCTELGRYLEHSIMWWNKNLQY